MRPEFFEVQNENAQAPQYILYKPRVCIDTLNIVRYLHSRNVDARPSIIVERDHPQEVTELPSIFDTFGQKWYIGLDQCCDFYEKLTGETRIHLEAANFADGVGGAYRISDRARSPVSSVRISAGFGAS